MNSVCAQTARGGRTVERGSSGGHFRSYQPTCPPVKPCPGDFQTRHESVRFEARRLHNLLLLAEHGQTPDECISAGAAVCRALRRFLADFFALEGRA